MPNAGEFDAVLQYLKNKLPQLGFFSTLDEAIRAAPFEKAPAQQWQNYLKPGLAITRNGVQFPLKAEELRYSGLPELLHTFGPEGDQINRENLASNLHSPIDPDDMRLSKDVLLEHLHRNRAGFNLHVGMEGSNTPSALSKRLPELDLLEKQPFNENNRFPPTFGDARFSQYAHPAGVPNSYEENITRSPDFGHFPSHFGPRDLSWSRTTRHYLDPVTQLGGGKFLLPTERDSSPTARLVEEIQSDRHQAAADKVFDESKLPVEARVERNSLYNQLSDSGLHLNRNGPEAQRLREIEAPATSRRGYRTPEEEAYLQKPASGPQDEDFVRRTQQISRKPPDTPFKDPADYGLLELKKQLLNSIQQGDSHLAIVRPEDQIDRYGTESARDAGMQHIYGNVYPSALKKLARMYGANVKDLPLSMTHVADETPRIPFLEDIGLDTPSEHIYRMGGPDQESWNAADIDQMMKEMADMHPQNPAIQAHLSAAQAHLDNLSTYEAVVRDYLDHGDEPYIGEDGEETSAMDPNDFMAPQEVDRSVNRLADSLDQAHSLWQRWNYPNGREETVQKTFPALEITPEVAEKIKSTGIPLFKRGGEAEQHFDDGGSVEGQQTLSPQEEIPGIPQGEMMSFREMPPAMLTQMTLDRIAKLYQPAMQMPAYGEGGTVAEFAEELDKMLDQLANEHAAKAAEAAEKAPHAVRPPLVQHTEDPLVQEIFKEAGSQPGTPQSPLSEGFLSKRQAFADGGSTGDDYHSALNWLSRQISHAKPIGELTGGFGYPYTKILDLVSPKGRARVAVRAAQQLYGVDQSGHPVFLGGMLHQGATPPGIVDEALSVPDSVANLEETLMRVTPGPNGNEHDLIHALDPQWSRNASKRLSQLNQSVHRDTGIGDPETLAETAEDFAGQLGPIAGAARLAGEGTLARKALDQIAGWGAAGSQGTPDRSWLSEPSTDNPVADMALGHR